MTLPRSARGEALKLAKRGEPHPDAKVSRTAARWAEWVLSDEERRRWMRGIAILGGITATLLFLLLFQSMPVGAFWGVGAGAALGSIIGRQINVTRARRLLSANPVKRKRRKKR